MKCSIDPIKIPLEQTFNLESETWAPTVPPFGFVFVFYAFDSSLSVTLFPSMCAPLIGVPEPVSV